MKKESNFPHEAIAIIDEVLQFGREKRNYPDSYWRTLSVLDHVNSAKAHLNDYLYNTNPGEDHLAHALTRLAMAVSNREATNSSVCEAYGLDPRKWDFTKDT